MSKQEYVITLSNDFTNKFTLVKSEDMYTDLSDEFHSIETVEKIVALSSIASNIHEFEYAVRRANIDVELIPDLAISLRHYKLPNGELVYSSINKDTGICGITGYEYTEEVLSEMQYSNTVSHLEKIADEHKCMFYLYTDLDNLLMPGILVHPFPEIELNPVMVAGELAVAVESQIEDYIQSTLREYFSVIYTKEVCESVYASSPKVNKLIKELVGKVTPLVSVADNLLIIRKREGYMPAEILEYKDRKWSCGINEECYITEDVVLAVLKHLLSIDDNDAEMKNWGSCIDNLPRDMSMLYLASILSEILNQGIPSTITTGDYQSSMLTNLGIPYNNITSITIHGPKKDELFSINGIGYLNREISYHQK